jgi:hypothetical protein
VEYTSVFNEVVSNEIPEALLPPVRRGIAEQMAGIEAKHVAQANAIARTMEVPLTFQCQLALSRSAEFLLPGVTLDTFLQSNDTMLLVSCMSKSSVNVVDFEEDAAWEAISKTLGGSGGVGMMSSGATKKLERRRSSSIQDMVADVVSSPSHSGAQTAHCLFDVSIQQFEVLLDELLAAEDSLTTLLRIIKDTPGKVKDVFFGMLTGKATIDHRTLYRALSEIGLEVDDGVREDLYEEGIMANPEVDFETFAKFVFKRPQQVFYRCIASAVTNHILFRTLGGRDAVSRERRMLDLVKENEHLRHELSKVRQLYGEAADSPSSPSGTRYFLQRPFLRCLILLSLTFLLFIISFRFQHGR